MKCTKCGESPKETDKLAWKCTSCGKAYGVTLTNIQKLQEKKDAGYTNSLLKCKECGEPLDNGNEKIFWKCSCGNVNCGGVKGFSNRSDLNKDVVETTSEITIHNSKRVCPKCNKILDINYDAKFCPDCGTKIEERDAKHTVKKIAPSKKRIVAICGGMCLIFVVVFIAMLYYNSSAKKLERYLLAEDYKKAQSIYDEMIVGDSKSNNRVKQVIVDILEQTIEDYGAGEKEQKSYENVKVFVEKNFNSFDPSPVGWTRQTKGILSFS